MKSAAQILALLFFLNCPLCAQTNAQVPAVPSLENAHGQTLHLLGVLNAGQITDFLYSGAQPGEPGFAELKKLGIATIIDLRDEDAKKIKWERKHAESLQMRCVPIPVNGWNAPKDEQIIEFLSLVRDTSGHKIFLHCRFGDDRTGTFIAVYRMAIENWSAEQAIREMYSFGFNGIWHPAMKSFVHAFPGRLEATPRLAVGLQPWMQP